MNAGETWRAAAIEIVIGILRDTSWTVPPGATAGAIVSELDALPMLRAGDSVDVIDGAVRRPSEVKHHWNLTGELVVVLGPAPSRDTLCANDDGAGRCGHPERAHGALGCMAGDPCCWCDEYVSPRSSR